MAEPCLAVDIGGTKMEVGLVDQVGDVTFVLRRPTPAGSDDLWPVLVAMIEEALEQARPEVCGVGCGGPMAPGGERVSPLNIPGWRDFPLRRRLADLTAVPVFIENDAKALALAEGWQGEARGVSNYLAMVVSTGVGGGLVIDGRLLDGRLGNAGHIGHVVVEPEGRPCACGGRGCLEAEASGLAIAAITGRPAEQAELSIVTRTGMLVGRAAASTANLLDLDLVVVAGSVALGFGQPFFEAAQAEIAARARLVFSADTVIKPAGLGSRGPLLGAAAVGWRGLYGDVMPPTLTSIDRR